MLAYRIQMHVHQPVIELFGVAHKPVPELVLPEGSLGSAFVVQFPRGNLFHTVDDLGYRERVSRPDQRMPVVGHHDIAVEQKLEPLARLLRRVENDGILAYAERLNTPEEVNRDEEDAI